MKKSAVVLLLLLVSQSVFCDDLKLYSFAGDLFNSGDYYRAITEYKRYIFYNPEGVDKKQSEYRIGVSYLKAEKYDEAASVFESITQKYDGALREAAQLAGAFSYSQKGDFKYSNVLSGKLILEAQDGAARDKAAYIEGFNYLRQGMFAEASGAFSLVKNDETLAGSCVRLEDYLKKSNDIEQRSEALSSLFSAVIPGAGYVYCGSYGDALISAAINAFFIYNTAVSFRNNSTAGKYTYGIPAAVFYLSNIYGSASAAKRFNDAQFDSFVEGAVKLRVDIINSDF